MGIRTCTTDTYNWTFDTVSGVFKRWGVDEDDDPQLSPLGPEIIDICVSKRCNGVGQPCKFCYQNSHPKGQNMSLETYQALFNKLPINNLTQVALGIGDLYGNPDLFEIMAWTREQGVIPNITVHGYDLDDAGAEKLAALAGAVAVSHYRPKDVCYDAVKRLTDAGLKQVNIHQLIAEETLADCAVLIRDMERDPRLAKLNATVFLAAKKKGRGTWLTPASIDAYKCLIHLCLAKGLRIGFDSCSCHKFLDAVSESPQYPLYETFAEPCESGLFSAYIDVDGMYYPCSFSTGRVKGINLFEVEDFMDVWHGREVGEWRKTLLDNNRRCPLYEI